ncbi:vascular cell adhesion protein 1-like [Scleropages formosus]|uniref:vascular cell adhesion protein 1-like n=1 Tax=Scleropages formosus TaxID=113540 RepID=UPI0008791862|nr:vascular cell adhesion protein 1-like [Scleropages formosus]XP_018586283.1 vascular cell adhesion protein 1-like [Scleropages formosus]
MPEQSKQHYLLLHVLCSVLQMPSPAGERAPTLYVTQLAHIKAAVGESVTLLCEFSYNGEAEDSKFGKFHKKGAGKNTDIPGVIRCQSSYPQRTPLLCNLTMTIPNVSPGNASLYYCEVAIPRPMITVRGSGSGTNVSVYAEALSLKTEQTGVLRPGQQGSLRCSATRLYPSDFTVRWFCRDHPVAPVNYNTSAETNVDGIVSLQSWYKFTPMITDDGMVCRCKLSHPLWTQERTASITLNISYGPQRVNLTSRSGVLVNGTLRLPAGSPLSVACTADGNPSPEIHWSLEGSDAQNPSGDLHIPVATEEHGGLYWCVARNRYGEGNASIVVLISQSTHATAGFYSLYGLLGVSVIVLLVSLVCCVHKKKQTKTRAELDRGSPLASEDPHPVDESQLIYSTITFPSGSERPNTEQRELQRSTSSTVLYSQLALKNHHRVHPGDQEEALRTVYVLTQVPLYCSFAKEDH